MLRIGTLLLCFFFRSLLIGQDKELQMVYQNLLHSLQIPISQAPKLIISTKATSGASFIRKSNTIQIDEKLIAAFSTLKEYKYSAIAFVLGHELCHALNKDKKDTDFIAYDKSKGSTYLSEQNADIQGAFVAYISGYNSLPIMNELIAKIYTTYNLNKNLSGYPSQSERVESIQIIKEQVESLIALFKMANLTMIAGHHDIAKILFDKVYTYYPSPEIAHNNAVNHILEAINIGNYKRVKYILPIEIDWTLRLIKPEIPNGQKDLEPDLDVKSEILLKKAESILKDLLLKNPDYIKSWYSLISIKIIQQNVSSAKSYLQKIRLKDDEYYVLESLLHQLENNNSLVVKSIQQIKSERWKLIANQNRSRSENKSLNCTNINVQPLSSNSNLVQKKHIDLEEGSFDWTLNEYKFKTDQKYVTFSQVNADLKNCKPAIVYGNFEKWPDNIICIVPNNSNFKTRQYFKYN